MKKYINPENERNQFMVRETLNGYAIQVLNTSNGMMVALTPQTAAMLQVRLPDPPLAQSCTLGTAERYIDKCAALNGWVAVETQE